jgi:hypothetical protein
MNKHFTLQPTDWHGKPYIPARSYSWLDAPAREDIARDHEVRPEQVEWLLDNRDAQIAKMAERREYDDPYGYSRSRY